MDYVGAQVAADNAMPGGVVLLVKLLLDESSNVLLNVVLFQRLRGAPKQMVLLRRGGTKLAAKVAEATGATVPGALAALALLPWFSRRFSLASRVSSLFPMPSALPPMVSRLAEAGESLVSNVAEMAASKLISFSSNPHPSQWKISERDMQAKIVKTSKAGIKTNSARAATFSNKQELEPKWQQQRQQQRQRQRQRQWQRQ